MKTYEVTLLETAASERVVTGSTLRTLGLGATPREAGDYALAAGASFGMLAPIVAGITRTGGDQSIMPHLEERGEARE